MPLVRFGVKNEFKLGAEELYKDGVQSEDPKAVLDGVAVAGLVGLLRQLGDLSQFAAEVFHGLQEQVASTSSRSRKLVNRVQRIEASLPSIEKAILSQTDHLRFAYTPGSDVHACIRIERNHFIRDDLPHYIMDSYEECRDPPRLQLLDRFDSGGAGSCLKRYSDPTFFKRPSSCSEVSTGEKSLRETKAWKIKKRRSRQQSGQFPKSAPILNNGGRMQFSSNGHEQSSTSHTGSNFDMTFKSEPRDQSGSRGSKNGMDFIDCVSRPSISSAPLDQTKNKGLSSLVKEAETNTNGYRYSDGQLGIASDENICSYDVEESLPRSSTATWDERLEVLEPTDVNCVVEDNRKLPLTNSSHHELECKFVNEKVINQVNDLSEHLSNPKSEADGWHLKTSVENLMKPAELNSGINEVEDSQKTNLEHHDHYLDPPHPESCTQVVGLSEGAKPPGPTSNGNLMNGVEYKRLGTSDAQYLVDATFDVAGKEMEMIDSDDVPVDAFCNVKSIEWGNQESRAAEAEDISEDYAFCEGGKAIEWNQRDLETINPESISHEDAFSDGGKNVKVIEWKRRQLETVIAENVGEMDITSEGGNDVKLIGWNQQELEAQIDEDVRQVGMLMGGENTVEVIEWNEVDDVDSGTENFVDALNTIESESESEFETEPKTEVLAIASQDELEENTMNDQKEENSSHLLPEYQNLSISYECKEGDLEDLERPITLVTSANDQIEEKSSHLSPEYHHLSTSYKFKKGDLEDKERPITSVTFANDQIEEKSSHLSPEFQNLSTSCECKEDGDLEDLERPTTSASSMDHIWSSLDQSESAAGQKLDVPTCLDDEVSLETNQAGGQKLDVPTSVNMLTMDHLWSSHDQSESVAGQKRDVPTCLDDEVSLETSRAAGQKLDVPTYLDDEVSLETTQTATLSDVPQGVNTCATLVIVKPAVSGTAKSGSEAPGDERIIHAPNVTQETSVGPSTSHPLAFWSNGTLLGLAPSKPVVFNMPNSSAASAPTNNGNTVGRSSNDFMQKVDGPASVLASSTNKVEHGSNSGKYGQYVGSNHLSQQRSEKTHNTPVGHDTSNSCEHPAIRDLINGDVVPPESKVSLCAKVKNVSFDGTGSSEDGSSLLSMLSRGMLKNGLHNSGSLGYDERNESGKPSKSKKFDNRCQEAVAHPARETNLIGKLESPINSPPPSPPLEHMKISFQPVDGFDASRLKLKYPEGIDQYENTFDAFPSFQLVPESTKLPNDIGSDSDDDTFCRSYAGTSDVSQIHQSDSDSEQWESGDSTESNDHTLYNGLHRITSTESASTSPQHEEADDESINEGSRSVSNIHSLSDPSFCLPVLGAKNPFAYQEMKPSIKAGEDSSHLQEPTHEPPPLPPLQWRISRPLFDEVEDNQNQKSDSLSQSFATKLSNSLIAHPAKVDSAKLISTTQVSATIGNSKESTAIAKTEESAANAKSKESAPIAKPKKVEEQNFGQVQAYHAEKERKMDDGGDFLHQIRTKSFNLKRTEPARPIYAPTAATSTKITAILQKASAIRKAVGSDDGEDDSWSDA